MAQRRRGQKRKHAVKVQLGYLQIALQTTLRLVLGFCNGKMYQPK
jgi:hypothetical protein